MNDELKDYDCLADVRKIRARITAKYANNPEAWFKHLEEVPKLFFDRLGIRNDWVE